MRVKIVSDGTVSGTNVIDAETGKPLQQVVELDFSAVAAGEVTAVLRIAIPELHAEADAIILPEIIPTLDDGEVVEATRNDTGETIRVWLPTAWIGDEGNICE